MCRVAPVPRGGGVGKRERAAQRPCLGGGAPRVRLEATGLRLVLRIGEAHHEIAFGERAFGDREFELIGALAAVPAGRDHLQVGRRVFFPRLQEKDVTGGRDLPGDRIADRNVGDLLILGKENLGRGADDAVDLDDIDGVVGDVADAGIAKTGLRLLQRQGRLGKSKHQDHRSAIRFTARPPDRRGSPRPGTRAG